MLASIPSRQSRHQPVASAGESVRRAVLLEMAPVHDFESILRGYELEGLRVGVHRVIHRFVRGIRCSICTP
jgi:hypothetical protein